MTIPAPTYDFDLFLSYSHTDGSWVHEWLLPRLEQAGLRVCIDVRDFAVGVPSLVNMEKSVERSHHTLLVLSPAWLHSEWTAFEAVLVQTLDPAGRRRRLLPLLVERCDLPLRLRALTYLDCTDPARRADQVDRLIAQLREADATTLGPAMVNPVAAVAALDTRVQVRQRLLAAYQSRLDALLEDHDAVSRAQSSTVDPLTQIRLERRQQDLQLQIARLLEQINGAGS